MTHHDDTAITERGIALIRQVVTKMGFHWYERNLDGIGGAIGIPQPATAERLILVHSRARNRSFLDENDRGFYYQCGPSDLNGWMTAAVPVILICSHPQRNAAWWMHTQDWFSDPDHRVDGRIHFSKRTQRFNGTTSSRLQSLPDPR